jgi:hypothetical protein
LAFLHIEGTLEGESGDIDAQNGSLTFTIGVRSWTIAGLQDY